MAQFSKQDDPHNGNQANGFQDESDQAEDHATRSLSTHRWQAVVLAIGLVLGVVIGSGGPASQAVAQPAKPVAAVGATIGVSIPANGAALVKGTDGNAYIVTSTGVAIRVSRAGKPLPLP